MLQISCKDNQKSERIASTGNPSEILVLLPENFKNTQVEKTLIERFQSEQVGLPQQEPIFDLLIINPDAFKNIFLTHRNILRITIDANISKPYIQKKEDINSKSQQVIEIFASDERSFTNIMEEKGALILGQFYKSEITRLQKSFSNNRDTLASSTIKKLNNISIVVPKRFSLAKSSNEFVWLRNERQELSEGIFVYSYPYIDSSQLQSNNLIQKRNEILKKFVPGALDNSYMTTEMREQVYIQTGNIIDSLYTIEIRGLWRIQGDSMGGPFVSYTIVDTIKNKIITSEGFVYAQKLKKRDYLRQLEAMLKTIELPYQK